MDTTITFELITSSFIAGFATILAPCILPIIPLFISNASTGSKLKPFATASGLVTTFVILGVIFTGLGQSVGLDQESLNIIASLSLIFVGYTYFNVEYGYRFWGGVSRFINHVTKNFPVYALAGISILLVGAIGDRQSLSTEQSLALISIVLLLIHYTYAGKDKEDSVWFQINRMFASMFHRQGTDKRSFVPSGDEKPEDSLYAAYLSGMSLGIAWIPCTGPTLGLVLTTILGSDQNIIGGGFLLFVYAIGSVIPILLISYIFRGALDRVKSILKYEKQIKQVAGAIVVVIGFMLLLGWFRDIETRIVDILPEWEVFSGL